MVLYSTDGTPFDAAHETPHTPAARSSRRVERLWLARKGEIKPTVRAGPAQVIERARSGSSPPLLAAACVLSPPSCRVLYSASDDWKKERAWIVRFLSDGIVGNEEWRILKRRHTWDLLASLFQSEERDRTLRRGVLEVLANVTCNARATTSLILRHALLSWIEMQVQTVRAEEAIAWARILENILAVVSPAKLEAATSGEWRAIIVRCARMILHHPGVFTTLSDFVVSRSRRLCCSMFPRRVPGVGPCNPQARGPAWEPDLSHACSARSRCPLAAGVGS
ncbi:hypothetical protein NUW54_g14396 [Trametes sanguinea]|uniref:Uncharacterized protein n=1 Tax=Trametes sanguinea TaxID=158606 RepID=A0ACC1MCF5_9APHY|nr:hypothetical protein NUW54_g14396 [Trametes sanguinea]